MVKAKRPKGPVPVISMGCSQPADWVELFRSSASLEGLTFSEWVALACLDRAAWMSGKTAEELASGLSIRATRGRPRKEAESC